MEDVEVLFEGLFGGGEEDFHFHGGSFSAPVDEDDLGDVHVVGVGELVVEDGVSVLLLGQGLEEIVPGFLLLAESFNNLCRQIQKYDSLVDDVVDNVAVVDFSEFELVEFSLAVVVGFDVHVMSFAKVLNFNV